jgi:hypothetical protein
MKRQIKLIAENSIYGKTGKNQNELLQKIKSELNSKYGVSNMITEHIKEQIRKENDKTSLQGNNLKDQKPFSDCSHKTCHKCNVQANYNCSYHCPCHSCIHTDCTSNTARFNVYLNGDIYLEDYYKPIKEV